MDAFNSLQDALLWLEKLPKSSSRIYNSKLEKLVMMRTLLELCENPHAAFRIIHITGSKGKSTMAKTADAVLHLQNYKSGLFISPHVNVYNERICIDGQMISDEEFLRILNYIHARVLEHQQNSPDFVPTVFETLTAAAFCAFKNAGCQWAVVEVGIGGRYDTTNVIDPELCIIGEIEYEHTDVLGRTIREIAHDKAGIIKRGVPVWVAAQVHGEVMRVLGAEAKKQGSALYYMPDHCTIEDVVIKPAGTRACVSLALEGETHTFTYETATLGKALLDDQVLAHVAVAHYIANTTKNAAHVAKMVNGRVRMQKNIALPARCELLQGSPSIFLDGAHTEQSIKNSCACLEALFPRACLVIGMLKGKNHRGACAILRAHRSFFSHIVVTTCGQDFDSAHETLYEMLKKDFSTLELCTDIELALTRAREFCTQSVERAKGSNQDATSVIGVIGSLYLCSTARALCVQA